MKKGAKNNSKDTQSEQPDFASALSRGKILVVGDVIVDVYHYGSPLKISSETPTIVAKDERVRLSWGGAGLLVRNILELGGAVVFISVIGDDRYANYEKDFVHKNLTKHFIVEPGRKTTVKERFWVNGYKLLQWDQLDNRDIAKNTEYKVLKLVTEHLSEYDKLVISDYRHGLMTRDLAAEIVALGRKYKKPVYIDSQIAQREGNHAWYHGASLISLNMEEAQSLDPVFSPKTPRAALERISGNLSIPNVVVKLGEHGSAAIVGDAYIETPAYNVVAVDTCGAGDAFFSILSVCHYPPHEAVLRWANIWAGLSTTVVGAEPPRREDFLKLI